MSELLILKYSVISTSRYIEMTISGLELSLTYVLTITINISSAANRSHSMQGMRLLTPATLV